MKKLLYATMLLLGMTACKKEEVVIPVSKYQMYIQKNAGLIVYVNDIDYMDSTYMTINAQFGDSIKVDGYGNTSKISISKLDKNGIPTSAVVNSDDYYATLSPKNKELTDVIMTKTSYTLTYYFVK